MRWSPLLIIAVVLLQSCAQTQPKEPPVSAQDALPEPVVRQTVPVPEVPVQVAPAPVPPTQVVILVSGNIPAYSEVARALAKELGQRGSIRYLNGNQTENIKQLADYKNDKHTQFVSIGLSASVAAKTLTDRQVVFCQVFNYQDHGLLSARHKGVSMMPSLSKTFSTWRTLAPNTTDIGVISGQGFEDMMQTASAAAKAHGFRLHHASVNTDKEYQYAYKQMAGKVQGYWLIPDNRVLSGNILRDVMTFSVRNSKQVVVFSEELLKLGGLFSTSSDNQDIARQVLNRIEHAQNKDVIPGPDIVHLDKLNLRINSVMAQRLNLEIPEQYRKYQHAP
jgi:ABC-type uncharacterized transport system substrate-binding protein